MKHVYRDSIKVELLAAASVGVNACGGDVGMEEPEMTTTDSGLVITTTQTLRDAIFRLDSSTPM